MTEKTTITMRLTIPNELNETLLDKVRAERKKGRKTSKEKIIIELLTKHRKDL